MWLVYTKTSHCLPCQPVAVLSVHKVQIPVQYCNGCPMIDSCGVNNIWTGVAVGEMLDVERMGYANFVGELRDSIVGIWWLWCYGLKGKCLMNREKAMIILWVNSDRFWDCSCCGLGFRWCVRSQFIWRVPQVVIHRCIHGSKGVKEFVLTCPTYSKKHAKKHTFCVKNGVLLVAWISHFYILNWRIVDARHLWIVILSLVYDTCYIVRIAMLLEFLSFLLHTLLLYFGPLSRLMMKCWWFFSPCLCLSFVLSYPILWNFIMCLYKNGRIFFQFQISTFYRNKICKFIISHASLLHLFTYFVRCRFFVNVNE